jgi:hypothetical protein
MELLVQYIQMFFATFDWMLSIYSEWWAWAPLGLPAIACTLAGLSWIMILVSPFYFLFNGMKTLLVGMNVALAKKKDGR